MNTTASIYLHDQFEEVEAVTVIDLLRRADIKTDVISLESTLWVKGSHGVEVKCDLSLAEAKLEYEAHIIPGGPGINALLKNDQFIELVKSWGEKGVLMAAICAAPQILSRAGLLKGKKITCFPSIEASISESHLLQTPVVQDKNIITSRGAGTAIPFALAIIEKLQGTDKAEVISKQIVFS